MNTVIGLVRDLRHWRPMVATWLVAGVCLAVTGCGSSTSESDSPAANAKSGTGKNTPDAGGGKVPQVTSTELKRYAVADLRVQPGDPLPPLDGGNLQIAVPQEWDWARPQSDSGKQYLIGFHRKGSSLTNLPRILIEAEEAPAEFPTVTEASLDKFVQYVGSTVSADAVRVPVQPLILGDIPCSRHVESARRKTVSVPRQVIKTVVNGRMYTVSLEVLELQFELYRDAAYAVVASIQPPASSRASAVSPDPSEDPPIESGAATPEN